MWKLRLLAILLIAGGAGLLAFGIHIEWTLREQRGSGVRRFFANVFYSGDIDHYRSLAFHAMLYAPGLIVFGFGIWALVSWIKRAQHNRLIERELLLLKPAARKELINRGLSGRKLVKELMKNQKQRNPEAPAGAKACASTKAAQQAKSTSSRRTN